VSCRVISIPALDSITPVIPPIVNRNIKPTAKYIGARQMIAPPHIVAIQLNTFIPVGMAITIVAAVKYARVLTSIPDVYI
jgi:hypothetical protein